MMYTINYKTKLNDLTHELLQLKYHLHSFDSVSINYHNMEVDVT